MLQEEDMTGKQRKRESLKNATAVSAKSLQYIFGRDANSPRLQHCVDDSKEHAAQEIADSTAQRVMSSLVCARNAAGPGRSPQRAVCDDQKSLCSPRTA